MKSIYNCHYSNIKFSGHCPVKMCWANIDGRHASGCAYYLLGNKDIQVLDLSWAFKISKSRVQEKIENGREILSLGLKILEVIEFEKIDVKLHCENCGIEGPNCLDLKICQRRRKKGISLLRTPLFMEIANDLNLYLLGKIIQNSKICQMLLDLDFGTKELTQFRRLVP